MCVCVACGRKEGRQSDLMMLMSDDRVGGGQAKGRKGRRGRPCVLTVVAACVVYRDGEREVNVMCVCVIVKMNGIWLMIMLPFLSPPPLFSLPPCCCCIPLCFSSLEMDTCALYQLAFFLTF